MTTSSRILIVDDNTVHLRMCCDILRSKNYDCIPTSDPIHALSIVESNPPDAIILDLKMPKFSGMRFLKRVNRSNPDIPVIILTAFASIEKTVEAIKHGAFDFVNKPIRSQEFIPRVRKALQSKKPSLEDTHYLPQLAYDDFGKYNLIGNSAVMLEIYQIIKKVAAYDLNVFISGETGTGKELAAEAICKLSKRANAPFVPIDCAGISESLIESELFGHEKGAFTGASGERKGLLETANCGTIFLDEITEMPIELQTKFLRVLERGHIRRVGSTHLVDLNIRVISATNRNPIKAIKEHRLREDLYYRLNGLAINLPPLRSRDGDFELLSDYFLKQTAMTIGEPAKSLSPEAISKLKCYHWPGNVRELFKLMEQLQVMSEDPVIKIKDLPAQLREIKPKETIILGDDLQPYKVEEEKCLRNLRKVYLRKLQEKYKGNIAQMAKNAGVDRSTIYRWQREIQ